MMTSAEKRKQAKSSQREIFRINPVAVGCTLLMLATGAYAQEAAKLDTVVVSGIRKGIEDAISVKRTSDSIVEAISAEDIGKLPDASVAESISRLPGVSTQRNINTGQAEQISVRGLAPEFNGGLLNGREQASTSAGRSVNFDMYPAELLSGVLIYKTPEASLVGQGLASTIDMQTVRPLNVGARTVVLNYRREANTKSADLPGFQSGSGDRASLSYIDQFADRTIGVVLGLTHYKNKGASETDFNSWGGWVADSCPQTPDASGKCPVATVKTPGGFGSRVDNTSSTKDAVMATLQYKPNKDFETSLDMFYNKSKFTLQLQGLEGAVGGLSTGPNDLGGQLINATVDANGVATSGTFTNFKGVIDNHVNNYDDTVKSFGWGTKLNAGSWALKSDLSYSEAVDKLVRFETTAGIPGNAFNAADTISYSGFNGHNLADVVYKTGLNYADPSIIKLTDPQGWAGPNGVQDGYYASPTTTDKVKALRLSGKRELTWGFISGVNLGVNYTDRSKDRVGVEGALILNGALNADGSVANRLISAPMPNSSIGAGGMTGIPTLYWNPTGSLGTIYALNPWTDANVITKNWGVDEKVSTGFLMGDIDTSIGGVAVRGNVGVQVQSTRQSSTGLRVDEGSCNSGTHQCTYSPLDSSHSYTDVLPTLNLVADFSNGNVLRFGLGRVLARPQMSDLRPTMDFGLNSTDKLPSMNNLPFLKGTAGNPNLEPFRADQIDISYEKYFGKKGYVSIAGFYKDLKTYILNVSSPYDFAGDLTPTTVIPPGNLTKGLLTKPINGTGGSISGIELTLNVPFSLVSQALDGFGAMVNYSNTSSSVAMPTSGFTTSNISSVNIPLPGLSKQVINLRAYYEKNGFQIAVARRSRSDYLGSISDYQDNSKFVMIKGEAQVDMQVSYEFQTGTLKGLSLLAQGTNLTDAPFVQYDVGSGNTTDSRKYGKGFMAGLNYKF